MYVRRMLSSDGVYAGEFRFEAGRLAAGRRERRLPRLDRATYVVDQQPIDFHCHGVGGFDFSDLEALDLDAIDRILADEGLRAVLTVYLPHDGLPFLRARLEEFAAGRRRGRLGAIAGFAVEGPVLTSPGGTPLTTIWGPTKSQWHEFSALGALGLKYMVLSPDMMIAPDRDQFLGEDRPPDMSWIVEALLDGGVLPALGHFQKHDPQASAQAVRDVLQIARRRGVALVSDHLMNDMPRAIPHAWRSGEEQARRSEDLAALHLEDWSIDDLPHTLGPVPAALIQGCLEGDLTPCVNFDGFHLDLAVAVRLVELIGADRIIGMTDRIEGRRLAGRELTLGAANTLLYQENDIVAAGTSGIARQASNLLTCGLSGEEIWRMFCFNPARTLAGANHLPDPVTEGFIVRPGDRAIPVTL